MVRYEDENQTIYVRGKYELGSDNIPRFHLEPPVDPLPCLTLPGLAHLDISFHSLFNADGNLMVHLISEPRHILSIRTYGLGEVVERIDTVTHSASSPSPSCCSRGTISIHPTILSNDVP
ncbi:hypothetical protein CBL_07956 [Carabus blaptoides fortunei]